MAYSINKVILVGNVGNDPEVKTFQSGDRVVNFSIATSESWKDKETGEQKSVTEWHKIAIFNTGLIDITDRFVKKGMKVYIEGQLQTRKWTDQQGQEKYTTEVVLQRYRGELTMLGGRADSMAPTDYSDKNSGSDFNAGLQNESSNNDVSGTISGIDDLDDEIPF